MSGSKVVPAHRLDRLQTVFAARRARLAADIARVPSRPSGPRPLVGLQRYGYSAAVMLVLTAALPAVLRFAFRRRKMLFSAATTALRMRSMRNRLKAMPDDGRRR